MSANLSTSELTSALKSKALELGFEACGISHAAELTVEKSRLEEWLRRGNQASMGWMERNQEKRVDPTVLVEGAKSVVSVIQSYYHPFQGSTDPDTGRISRYAWGDDYHLIIKDRLHALLNWLEETSGPVTGRAFVDSAPVMDKAWAARAGLGWIGKHSNLISPDHGSWFFIGELIIDTELIADKPIADQCGTCTRCLDACPTGAITEPYVVDANLCISYTTIEHRGSDVAESVHSQHGNWIFGCDICQEVCPWNKFRTESSEMGYAPREGVLNTPLEAWSELSPESFSTRFRRSAVKRTKLEGFTRNVRYALGNVPEASEPNPGPAES
jgi:epoxyqueuosine reductase